MSRYKTHKCDEISKADIGRTVTISGFVDTIRDLGGVVFLDIRDMYGITQVVTSGDGEKVNFVSHIPIESVVAVTGIVRARSEETLNKKIATGEVEILIQEIEILGKRTAELPFDISNADNVKEDLRLQYRFLDLRRKKLRDNIILRAKVIQHLRNKMVDQGFLEVQTPILTSSSPEGARDYLVPSRLNPGKFYALPQAPQQFKQLLMTAGMDKYFQIAPCFRDEDARADRAPGEFYQLDMEMSFADQEDVFSVVEDIMTDTFQKFSDKKVTTKPFNRISYKDAILKYGTDKPDLRNPLEIVDVTDIFSKLELKAFKDSTVRIITVYNVANRSRSFFEGMTDYAIKELKAPGLAWIRILEDEVLQGPIAKYITGDAQKEMLNKVNAKAGDAIFFIAGSQKKVEQLSGEIRDELGKRLELINKDTFKFCWIVDFPMYELKNDKIEFSHNPFSMPQGGIESLLTKQPLDVIAYQYDLVCNGVELASGAVRNHSIEIMTKAFEIAGYTKEDLETKFGALYKAFQYGTPPHAGIAPGVDRMLMLLTETENIKNVIAFPMTGKAEDLLMKAPGYVTKEQLKELNIKIDIPKFTN